MNQSIHSHNIYPCVCFYTQGLPSSEVLKPLADIAIKLARLEEFTGRTAPTVIT